MCTFVIKCNIPHLLRATILLPSPSFRLHIRGTSCSRAELFLVAFHSPKALRCKIFSDFTGTDDENNHTYGLKIHRLKWWQCCICMCCGALIPFSILINGWKNYYIFWMFHAHSIYYALKLVNMIHLYGW